MKCPICNQGKLIKPTRSVPDWMQLPVFECTECGDLLEAFCFTQEELQQLEKDTRQNDSDS